jgi:hypothetical protein
LEWGWALAEDVVRDGDNGSHRKMTMTKSLEG